MMPNIGYKSCACQLAKGEDRSIESVPMAQSDGITPAILLGHMQGMEQRLRDDFSSAILASEGRLRSEIKFSETNIIRQIEGIDERVDDIECVQIPMLKKAVGIR